MKEHSGFGFVGASGLKGLIIKLRAFSSWVRGPGLRQECSSWWSSTSGPEEERLPYT